MTFDWFSALIGWIGGIPSALFANWLFHKFWVGRKSKGEYFNYTSMGDTIEFEGKIKRRVDIKKTINEFLQGESPKSRQRKLKSDSKKAQT